MREAVAKDRTAVVVGAGLTGLTAAIELRRAGFEVAVHEASDNVGGRVRTDEVDGFTLDRGFQVYLTAYPEGLRLLDHVALDLRPFETGAIVRRDGDFHKVADPIRRPELILESLRAGIGSFGDKLKVTKLRNRAVQCSLQELWRRPEKTALEVLEEIGFSDSIIDSFFRPWLGGIFLTRDLDVSSRVMDFVVRMMARGDTALPARGMQAIPRQLAQLLPEDSIHLNSPVRGIENKTVHLADGTPVNPDAIVVGTEAPVAAKLLGKPSLDVEARSVTCIYFAADEAPFDDPWLVLNGEPDALVNNLVVPSNVAREYAPAGSVLISATVLDAQGLEGDDLVAAVRNEMRGWYGEVVDRWSHLRTYTIDHAQPRQDVGFRERRPLARRWEDCVLVACGDYTDSASINGAMLSGRRAADYILNALTERKPVAAGAA